jgi:probable F420-dependent oxidoreductase
MKLGVVFPQTEIGSDPHDIARFATEAESTGFDHLIAYDHVLGASTASRPDWRGPYTSKSMFHEPFVLFGFLAAQTSTIELVTGVIILPQRQTALVAKQAACVDVLSGGRLRLGIGTGWNPVEYEALGQSFTDRGARSAEQIDLLRKLFAEETITYNGRWHTVTDAGIHPLPVHRRVPIWLGGMHPRVMQRVAKLGDGWIPFVTPQLGNQLEQLRKLAESAGRDPSEIGVQCMLPAVPDRDRVRRLADLGVTHVAVVTMNQGHSGAQAHIDATKRFYDAAHE